MTNYIIPYKMFVGCFLPNWLLKRKGLSLGAKVCYARLCQFSGENGKCYPSQETLAEELSTSSRNIRNYLKELEAVKLIETVRSGNTKPNRYLFPEHEMMCLKSDRKDSSGQDGGDRKDSSGQNDSDRKDSSAHDRKDSSYKEKQLRESETTTEENQGKGVVVVSSVLERIPEEYREELKALVESKLDAGKSPESIVLNILYTISHAPAPGKLGIYASKAVDNKYAENSAWTPKAEKKKPEVNHEQIQAEAEERERQRRVEAEAEEIEREKQRFLSLPEAEKERLRQEFLKIAKPFDAKRIRRGSAEVHNLPSFLYFLKSA